jgi:protein-disulfide isomerase
MLGKPDATTTLIVYEDIQCPFCREFTEGALPSIVDEYVRTGRVNVEWRGLGFIGPDSEKALRIALAAGKQNKQLQQIQAEAEQSSVQGTPTFFVRNGVSQPYQVTVASLTPGAFRPILNDALGG